MESDNTRSPADDPERMASSTLGHYDRYADDYWEGTRDHDVRQNIATMLACIDGEPPYDVLDFGCGPGRDLLTLARMGHRATGLEGAAKPAAMARAYSGCPVLEQNFLSLELQPAAFDGVFANASLFHVPARALPGVLEALWHALRPGGVLFSSNPRGDGQEGWYGERFGSYHTLDGWRAFMIGAGFYELTHYYRPPGLPRERQIWLASAWRKPCTAA